VKKFIRTYTGKFEMFNGSAEMIDKYQIKPDSDYKDSIQKPLPVTQQRFYMPTEKGNLMLRVGDIILVGNGGPSVMAASDFSKNYSLLPELPSNVASILKTYQHSNETLSQALSVVTYAAGAKDWFIQLNSDEVFDQEHYKKRQNEFALAWLFGYTVTD